MASANTRYQAENGVQGTERPHTNGSEFDIDRELQAETSAVASVPFLSARTGQCHWPLWEHASDPKLVCGEPSLVGCSY